ncbi:hypothetical protein K435DRAFT_317612 [Dendrothele bispora CBS 962.96]|uniref:Heme haloperoxidase family profile domain-containing protein n=1 Tax=Dendrothele bispora (strain CBS 962.96) TaxID=1314807 RepID=A0A4S8LGH4_DENBC|nr:hypothetical protein K435DRAFT_317612 [Dendrothele bispora CBS 962.96]
MGYHSSLSIQPRLKQGLLDVVKRSKEIRTVQYGEDTSISSASIAVNDHPRLGPHHHTKGKTCPILESRNQSEPAYCPTQESGVRSVCRALNTMANHGYVIISRNGCDLSFYDIHSGRMACYGLSSILAFVLTIGGSLLIKRSPIRLPPWFPCYCLSSTLAFVLTIGGFLLIRQSPICFTSRFPFGTVGRPTVNRSKPGRSRGEISPVWRLLLPRDWGGSTNFWSRDGTPRPNNSPETFKFGRPAAYRCNRKSGRRVDPIWFLHHLDWGSSVRWATYRRTRRLSKRRSEDFYDWINSLGNSWSSSPPGAFQNSSDFQINGSTLVSCERHYTTTNNYNHPMGPGNGGVSPEELLARNQQILELQHMIIQLQENDLNMKRSMLNLEQKLDRLQSRLPPGPEPPPEFHTYCNHNDCRSSPSSTPYTSTILRLIFILTMITILMEARLTVPLIYDILRLTFTLTTTVIITGVRLLDILINLIVRL